MQWRQKVELFEQLRREYEFGVGTIAGVARHFGVHRRQVRQALQSALPPPRRRAQRRCPQLDPVRAFIDAILEADRQAPRKQRHTAHRIAARIGESVPGCGISERRVREYVRERKLALGLLGREVMVAQSYRWGEEGQVDWYEAEVEIAGEREVVQVFVMRAMASGAAFHRAYRHATQQAFLEAHQAAFHYFGGVFRRLRYDNLKSAVKKVLRGQRPAQTVRFVAFRSHWRFAAEFCNPGQGHEKGGVEGEVGYFRRNHLVPVPQVESLAALNERLLAGCRADLERVIDQRPLSVGQALAQERAQLLPLATEDFGVAEEYFARVDAHGCVAVLTNRYSTPLTPGTEVRVAVGPECITVYHEGRAVASHERSYRRHQRVLNLEHYLDVLERKPGALAGSTALAQWRAAGRWGVAHDALWAILSERHGRSEGTQRMIELVRLGKRYGYERLNHAIVQALESGAQDAAAVRYLLEAPALMQPPAPSLSAGDLKHPAFFTRPLPSLAGYDQLLSTGVRP
ncbi:MAG: IS21 family transposase [Gammaproteobacteria bacterium]